MFRLFGVSALVFLAPMFAMGQSGSAQPVFSVPGTHCQTPKWSPDGQEVAIEMFSPKKDSREIVIIKLNDRYHSVSETMVSAGRSKSSALLGGGKGLVVELAWAPDRSQLSKPYIFSSLGPRKNFDLFADGAWLTTNLGNDGQPAWSKNGRYIAYVSQQSESGDIYLLDLQGDIEKPIRATHYSNSTEYRPQWSYDGSMLLFTRSTESGRGQDVGIIKDVTKPRESSQMIVQWSSDEIRPSWSPDGQRVSFYSNKSQTNKKRFDLWVANADGTGAKKLVSDVFVADVNGAVWMPDGKNILFVKRDFKRDNPVSWISVDGKAGGRIMTNTQLNSDLDLHVSGGRVRLVFTAHGLTGSEKKSWRQIFVQEIKASDLK
jgi:Tol biopolymer transport system component